MNECREKNLSISTVRRLREAGLYGKRLQWAKAHKDWTIEQWNKFLWIDESKFEIFESNKRVSVRRRVSERAAAPCIIPTLKHGGSSITVCVCVCVWGAFANCKVGYLYQV